MFRQMKCMVLVIMALVISLSAFAQGGQTGVTLSGVVTDSDNEPLPGVAVFVPNTSIASMTDLDGKYSLSLKPGTAYEVQFSYLGMVTEKRTVTLKESQTLNVSMKNDENSLDEVVVNGYFERRKESFAGSATSYSGEQLKEMGNSNLLKSLKNLDASFQITESLENGSNPNAMPNIQLRGQTSFNIQGDYDGNANQPLFILDGFETTLEKIWDLDMGRIQSVTLLKDAAAKAVYGSKAGNGVVVIETIRPKTGEMKVSYKGDLNLEVPDLSGYDLMNASEKLDWEVAHGKYSESQANNSAMWADKLYKANYDAIASGVDTYWLSKPLRTGVGQKHAVTLEGGDSKIRYILGGSYNDVEGVMKGSNRSTFNVNSSLSYSFKNMVFRNLMDFTTNVSKESPYGSFSDYVSLEPYFAPYDEDGNVKKILGYETVSSSGFASPVYNPLYNATLNVKDQSKYQTFTDNFDMDWHINADWRYTAKLSYAKTISGSDVFYPTSHTMFNDYDSTGLADRKGRYTKSDGSSNTISVQTGINWNHSFGKHTFFANATYHLEDVKYASTSVVAEGFGNDQMDDISMAAYYYRDSHPTGSDSHTRELGIIGAFNYSYADRYLVDLSINETGSSIYGSDNHWGTFWSAGAGWNIHKENFFSRDSLVKLLRLRYSIGYTGTQNFNPYQSRAMYEYNSQVYDMRMGAYLLGIPNTGLQWQKIYDNNIGADIALGNFFTGRFEYYIQNTDNMLSDITLPSSTGFNTYKENMGEMKNKGLEAAISITPWRNNEERGWLTFNLSAFHNKNTITKIYDIFKKANDDADNQTNAPAVSYEDKDVVPTEADLLAWRTSVTRPATKYYEGCSMTAIWAVRSVGIDPISGNEMYLDKNGNPTFTYSTDDQVVCGDTNPKVRGNVGMSAGWKGFSMSLSATYKLGGDMYNYTLIDRVENVTGFGNLDRRVAQTWNAVGDNALYRRIDMASSPLETPQTTKPTSRFVQKDNELYFSSLNISYDFYEKDWMKSIGLDRLRLSFYCNDFMRLNSVKVERGTSYPFARTFSFSLNATF